MDYLSNNPDQAQQLATVADQVGLQSSDLLVVGVDQPKRMRGLHLNSANQKTVAAPQGKGDCGSMPSITINFVGMGFTLCDEASVNISLLHLVLA